MPENRESDSDQREAHSSGPHPRDANTARDTAQSENDLQLAEDRKPLSRYERWQVALAIFGAVLATFGSYILYKQLELMDRQNTLMDRQNEFMRKQTELMDRQLTETREGSVQAEKQWRESLKASADLSQKAMESSATQSRAALSTSIAASRLDQRPWLIVQSCRLSAEPAPSVAIAAECDIINTGKTPAIDVYVQHDLRGVDGVPPSVTRQRVEFVVPKVHASRSLLAPGARPQTFTTAPYELNEAAVMQYRDGRATIFINAIIRYQDTFGIPHWTTYCAYHLIGQGLSQVLFCSGGNTTDHNEAANDPENPSDGEK